VSHCEFRVGPGTDRREGMGKMLIGLYVTVIMRRYDLKHCSSLSIESVASNRRVGRPPLPHIGAEHLHAEGLASK
jgi:hypothetical protein